MRIVTLRSAIVAALIAVAGCAGGKHAGAGAAAAPSAAAHQAAAAPANPDLGAVMERFYQQVEGSHWRFAYAMLSPRYRTTLSDAAFRERYGALSDLDVHLRQTTDRVVVARLDAADRADRARRRVVEETVTLGWDGEDWHIDEIRRRELNPTSR